MNTEVAAHRCSVAVLRNQNQPLTGVPKNFAIFRGKHLSWSLFLIFCEYCKISKNSFFHKTPPVEVPEN